VTVLLTGENGCAVREQFSQYCCLVFLLQRDRFGAVNCVRRIHQQALGRNFVGHQDWHVILANVPSTWTIITDAKILTPISLGCLGQSLFAMGQRRHDGEGIGKDFHYNCWPSVPRRADILPYDDGTGLVAKVIVSFPVFPGGQRE
jgi:hypothetical protein